MCHVLIIEDEPIVAMDLEVLLASAGATSFDVACSQDDAVASALKHSPEFITSDVRLTQGTGPLAVTEIHAALGPIPVIYITGTPGACYPRGADALVFTKPFNRAVIIKAFRECRSRSQITA